MTEKEIAIRLNNDRTLVPIVYRLLITCEGLVRLVLYQDKRDYFLNDCIIGRINVVKSLPKLSSIVILLVRKNEIKLLPGKKQQQKDEVIDSIDLTKMLRNIDQEEGKFFEE